MATGSRSGSCSFQLLHQLRQILRMLKNALALPQTPTALFNDKQPPNAGEHLPVQCNSGNRRRITTCIQSQYGLHISALFRRTGH